jgi:hypothetical protein
MANIITQDQLTPIVRALLRMIANLSIDNAATLSVILLYSAEAASALGPTRDAIRRQWKPILDSLEQSTPESIEEMLRKFEGPAQ